MEGLPPPNFQLKQQCLCGIGEINGCGSKGSCEFRVRATQWLSVEQGQGGQASGLAARGSRTRPPVWRWTLTHTCIEWISVFTSLFLNLIFSVEAGVETGLMHVPQCTCGVRGQLVGLGTFFHHVAPGGGTQVLRLGGTWRYLLSHLACWLCVTWLALNHGSKCTT